MHIHFVGVFGNVEESVLFWQHSENLAGTYVCWGFEVTWREKNSHWQTWAERYLQYSSVINGHLQEYRKVAQPHTSSASLLGMVMIIDPFVGHVKSYACTLLDVI